ncbi:hypothetical protein [Bradyrhizobium sp. B117]|uniref:hypothetical protein n=1 Tax=Bradyrhizobium sp. B117 TaxID=3140246 RepID=UPI00318332F9
MRISPSVVSGSDRDIYLVLDDFRGHLGRAWTETDEEHTDRKTLLRHLMEGKYSNPVRIVCFNTGEGWSRDASDDIAEELQQRRADGTEVPPTLQEFLQTHGRQADIQLKLPRDGNSAKSEQPALRSRSSLTYAWCNRPSTSSRDLGQSVCQLH